MHGLRMAFDLMPTDGEEAAANIAARLNAFPAAVEQYKRTLREAADAGHVSATRADGRGRRAVRRLDRPGPRQLLPRPGRPDPGATAPWSPSCGGAPRPRPRRPPASASSCAPSWLRAAATNQAAGPERYELASQYFLGAKVDQHETYRWGFEELHRLENEMRAVSAEIAGSGASIDEAVAALDADPARRIPGKEAFRDWMQQLADKAIDELNGTHFDIAEKMRRLECRITPTSDGSIYYTAPSEDFSRPGRMWWAVPEGQTEFSTWRETSTVYHEGVPGHHLQIGQTQLRADCSTAGSGCSAGAPGTARAGRCTPSA